MALVFISYAREEQPAARALAEDLRALGHQPWLDEALTGGQAWWSQILETIRRSDLVACVVGPGSLASAACKRELGYAIALGRTVLPVMVSDAVAVDLLPPVLANLQFVDLSQGGRDGFRALARALANVPTPAPLPDPLPPEPAAPVSYLGGAREQIETTSMLSFSDQSALLLRLKGDLAGPDRAAVLGLLRAFRFRPDLYARVSDEIDALIGPPAGPTPPPEAPPRVLAQRGSEPRPKSKPAPGPPPPKPSPDKVEGHVAPAVPPAPTGSPGRLVAAAAGLGLLLPVLQPAFYEAYAGAPASYLILSASPVVAGAALAGGVAWRRLGPGTRRRLAGFVPVGLAAVATLVAAAREPTPSGPAATLGLVCLVPLLLLGIVAPKHPALVIGLAILGLVGGIAAGGSIPLAGSLYEWRGALAFAWLVVALVIVALGRRQGRSRAG